ncbi:uncharacterized protein LOC113648235 [Tachysurus fulvidraco]|uniref:uncharacterized protein LOC113648235 n=1 Tax=Tachysurus fulvidraco TaxID=1234273 RepID=UPI001FEF60A2|nr:uncharacterized protein LOC113648235 [Tachysurus fulvidraco]
MADSQEDKLYKAEYAKSGRASCKKCKKDSLRMAIMVQSPKFDGKVPHWHHFSCFWLRAAVQSSSDISGFTDLRSEDQEKVKKAIESGGSVGGKADRKGAGKGEKSLNDSAVEYAKSNRSTCKGCDQKIEKASLIHHRSPAVSNSEQLSGLTRRLVDLEAKVGLLEARLNERSHPPTADKSTATDSPVDVLPTPVKPRTECQQATHIHPSGHGEFSLTNGHLDIDSLSFPSAVSTPCIDRTRPADITVDSFDRTRPANIIKDTPDRTRPADIIVDTPDRTRPADIIVDSPDRNRPADIIEDSVDRTGPADITEDSAYLLACYSPVLEMYNRSQQSPSAMSSFCLRLPETPKKSVRRSLMGVILDDVTLNHVSLEVEKQLYVDATGSDGTPRADRFAASLFKRLIPLTVYHDWVGSVNYDGKRGKNALPRNVRQAISDAIARKFHPASCDWKLIRDRINELLRKKRLSFPLF